MWYEITIGNVKSQVFADSRRSAICVAEMCYPESKHIDYKVLAISIRELTLDEIKVLQDKESK